MPAKCHEHHEARKTLLIPGTDTGLIAAMVENCPLRARRVLYDPTVSSCACATSQPP